MKGFKGFEPGLVCLGKKYTENTVFEEEEARICSCGMHFCPNPFDVLPYYSLLRENGEFNEFAGVEALAEVKTNDRRKYCTTKLKIGAKLSFAGFIKACVDFIVQIGISGDETWIGSSETEARIGSSGDRAQIGSSKNYAKIGSSGDSAKIGSSGVGAQIGSSGDSAQIGSSGVGAQIGSSGNSVKIGSSGNSVKIGSSGDYAQIGSSGVGAQIGSSGDYAQIGSSGDYAQIGSSGDYAQIVCKGTNSVICCAGPGGIVKAEKGCWITLSEWQFNNEQQCFIPVCVKTEYVDGEKIRAGVAYKLIGGEFIEVER